MICGQFSIMIFVTSLRSYLGRGVAIFVCLQILLNYSLNLPRRKVGREGRRIPLRLVAFH
jgi:hypothetical protein